MALEDYTVERGSYTDYINSGHRELVESINRLKDDVVVIGSDVQIVITVNNDIKSAITIDNETNPSFLNDFVAPMQRFNFKTSDSGKPGAMTAGGIDYESTGRFTFYLTKTFYESGENQVFYDTFCRTIGQLYKQQYMNVATQSSISSQHFGSLLSINAPIVTLKVNLNGSTMIRYNNVKFSSPAIKNGNFIVNDAIQLMFNFTFSYISLDSVEKSISFGGKQK